MEDLKILESLPVIRICNYFVYFIKDDRSKSTVVVQFSDESKDQGVNYQTICFINHLLNKVIKA